MSVTSSVLLLLLLFRHGVFRGLFLSVGVQSLGWDGTSCELRLHAENDCDGWSYIQLQQQRPYWSHFSSLQLEQP